jgi:DNA-directed RNA polymerase specialized sigma24 family protein
MGIDDKEFDDFILRLDPACADPKQGYERLRLKLVKFFAWKRCDDPEALADETIARLAVRIISKEEIRSEGPFVYGIATNVFREYLRDKGKQERLQNALTDSEIVSHKLDINDCQRQCWDELDRNKQEMLKKYYDEEHGDVMAKSLGITVNALRLQIHRVKNELKVCYEKCRKEKPER